MSLSVKKNLVLGGALAVTGGAALWYLLRSRAGSRKTLEGKVEAKAGAQPVFRYRREDFGRPDLRPLHFDLDFDVTESRVIGVLTATYVWAGKEATNSLTLDCDDLEVRSVEFFAEASQLGKGKDFGAHLTSLKSARALRFTVDQPNKRLIVELASPLLPGQEIVLKTVSVARPTENILEGLYLDQQEEGLPRNIITQCQQYGFQRIVPCIDSMAAKCYYTTTITADKRYTNIITNGDLAPGFYDASTGLPIYHEAAPCPTEDGGHARHKLKFHNHQVPMAPYLFFLGVGVYTTYRRQLEYCDGATVLLELLVFRNAERKDAEVALNAMHDSVLWCYVSTGPEMYEHKQEEKEIYALLAERDALRAKQAPLVTSSDEKAVEPAALEEADAERLKAVRARLAELISVWKVTGHQYKGQVYREIAMKNSDYGGMENVGNTTIIASRLLPSSEQSDPGYVYMEGVKIHEFYHDLNGSKVTGMSPFEIWLNEAVTVHIQRMREDDIFGHDFNRLSEVLYAFRPAVGPVTSDRGPSSMAIEPEGFNRTQELISAMTYSKAPEFVRMVELTIGKEAFARGLHAYHTKFAYDNATTADWIQSMAEAGGVDLTEMAEGWLKRTSCPHVTFTTAYESDAKRYRVKMTQTGFEGKPGPNNKPWHIPIDWALVSNGANTKEGVFLFKTASAELVIDNVETAPDFISFARDWSFFGSFENKSATDADLVKQALSDPDTVNRYFAYRAIADKEKNKIIRALRGGSRDVSVSAELVTLHHKILLEDALKGGTRAMIVREDAEATSDPELAHLYKEIDQAKTAMLQAVWDKYANDIAQLFDKCEAVNTPAPHKATMHERYLKAHCLSLMSAGAKPSVLASREPTDIKADVASLSRKLLGSPFATDRQVGLKAYLESDAEDRDKVLAEVTEEWSKTADSMENLIPIVASLDTEKAPEYIRQLIAHKAFNFNLAGHARAISRGWSSIRRRSLLTPQGRDLTLDLFLRIAKVNQMSAQPFIQAFSDFDKFGREERMTLLNTLKQMGAGVDPKQQESLFNQIKNLVAKFSVGL